MMICSKVISYMEKGRNANELDVDAKEISDWKVNNGIYRCLIVTFITLMSIKIIIDIIYESMVVFIVSTNKNIQTTHT